MSYAFHQCKNFENWLRFDKVTESLKEGTFFRHSVLLTDQVNLNTHILLIRYNTASRFTEYTHNIEGGPKKPD